MTAPAVDRVFPNDRSSYRYRPDGTLLSAAGARVEVFEDEDCLILATLRFYPGGQIIPGAVVVVGEDSLLPEFLEVSGRGLEVLWGRPEGSQVPYRLDSRLADRVAAVEVAAASSTGMGGRNFYRHEQLAPAAQWLVNHTLVRLPTVTLIIDGRPEDTDVEYPAPSLVVATFPEPTVGILICT